MFGIWMQNIIQWCEFPVLFRFLTVFLYVCFDFLKFDSGILEIFLFSNIWMYIYLCHILVGPNTCSFQHSTGHCTSFFTYKSLLKSHKQEFSPFKKPYTLKSIKCLEYCCKVYYMIMSEFLNFYVFFDLLRFLIHTLCFKVSQFFVEF